MSRWAQAPNAQAGPGTATPWPRDGLPATKEPSTLEQRAQALFDARQYAERIERLRFEVVLLERDRMPYAHELAAYTSTVVSSNWLFVAEADNGAVTPIQRFGSGKNRNITCAAWRADLRSIEGWPVFIEVLAPTDEMLREGGTSVQPCPCFNCETPARVAASRRVFPGI